ncbi:MAG: hypothetical protein ACI9VX_000839, partial [Dinoroseobacter sp.]
FRRVQTVCKGSQHGAGHEYGFRGVRKRFCGVFDTNYTKTHGILTTT